MILAKSEIVRNIAEGAIKITPFNGNQLNPNSYNLRLGDKMLVYNRERSYVNTKIKEETRLHRPAPSGEFYLLPNTLYLAQTMEHTETHKHVPMIEGRSSLGRLGVFIHVTAGFGDIGFCGYWTLEILVTYPTILHVGMEICQIFYHTISGTTEPYNGKYQNNAGVQASQMWKD